MYDIYIYICSATKRYPIDLMTIFNKVKKVQEKITQRNEVPPSNIHRLPWAVFPASLDSPELPTPEYSTYLNEFLVDVITVIQNAVLFNPPNHVIHGYAIEMAKLLSNELIPWLRKHVHVRVSLFLSLCLSISMSQNSPNNPNNPVCRYLTVRSCVACVRMVTTKRQITSCWPVTTVGYGIIRNVQV